jgi:hypothetical protein
MDCIQPEELSLWLPSLYNECCYRCIENKPLITVFDVGMLLSLMLEMPLSNVS